jgi:tetratricopeptide (TPR) repeat protein
MFEDLEGSTAFAATQGEEALRAVQRAHDRLARAELEPRHATDIVFLGDGYLAAFADPGDALDAAEGIQRAIADGAALQTDLRVRIGLHMGEVARDERGHLVGTAVHAASRITGKAAGGQILVSQLVHDAVVANRSFADRGLFWLKGFPERWRLHELLWGDGTQRPGAAHLVGREDERADLRRLREEAEAGHGRLALVGGEAGVGKTSLARDAMAEAAARGALTLAGHCYQMEAPPYVPFVEILSAAAEALPTDALREVLGDGAAEIARMWPDLHGLLPEEVPAPLALPPEQARRYLFNNLADAVERLARRRPLVVLLDDLQWADPSTVLFLQHLTQRLGDVPALLIGTYRDVELEPGVPFADAFDALIRQAAVERIALRRLTRDAVARVLGELADREPPPRLVDLVYAETEGNPFFVEEVFHHLAEEGRLFDAAGEWLGDVALGEDEVPRSVRLLLGRRLARLSDASRAALTMAAVVGRGVGLRLMQRLEPDGGAGLLDALDEAERAHLLTFVPEGIDIGLRFTHELIRQTLLADIPTLRRQLMHARVAEALEAMHEGEDPSTYASDLCHHLVQAGSLVDPAKTIRFLHLAGERDIEAAAFEEALERFEQALAMEPADPRTRADLEFGLGTALRSLGRWDEGAERWRKAIDAYERLGEHEAAGHASVYAAEQLAWTARWDEALVVAGEGLAALGDIANADRALLAAEVAVMFSAGGYKDAADQMLAEAEALAGDLQRPGLRGQVMRLDSVHRYFYGMPRQSVEVGLRAAELLRAAGDTWNLADTLSFVALNAAMTLDFDLVHEAAEESTRLAERLGHIPARWLAHRSAFIEAQIGELEPFERFGERDLELIRGLPWIAGASVFAAQAAFRRGRWEEAVELLERALEEEVAEALRPGDTGMLALALAYLGERDRAMRLYEDGKAAFADIGSSAPSGVGVMLTAAVEALWVLGERQEAARHREAMLAYGPKTGNAVRTWDARLVETLAGIAAAAARDWDAADGHFASATGAADRMGHLVEQADARRFHAQMLAERDGPGDRDRARAVFTDVIARYGRLGMPRHQRMTEALRAALG